MSTSVFSWIFGAVFFLQSMLPADKLTMTALSLLNEMSRIGWEQSIQQEKPGDEEQILSDLDYPLEISYDPDTEIQRATLDPSSVKPSIYFEIPVFQEKGQGYQKINRYLRTLQSDFFSLENESLASALEYARYAGDQAEKYLFERDAAVTYHSEHLVSVVIGYNWYMGGVFDYGSDCYTFRSDTGDLLKLTELIDAPEEDIRNMILTALKQHDAGEGVIDAASVAARDLDSFDFYVQDGCIFLPFDKYEVAYGAYGAFDVELPAEICIK